MSRPSFLDRVLSVLLLAVLPTGSTGLQAQRSVRTDTNHDGTQIHELMAGANGDSSIQFIVVGFANSSQTLWGPGFSNASRAMLVFFDAAGNETYRYKFPNDISQDFTEHHALIATAAFAALPGAPTPDFIIPPRLNPISGKVCFRGNTEEASFEAFGRNECVSYGSFTGDTEINFAAGFVSGQPFGPPAPALPIVGTTSLTRTSATESNASFALTDSPAPENRFGQTFTLPTATSAQQGETLFMNETFGGNGRTCASCHVPSLGLGLTPANIQSRFATLSSTFDPLFIGETNMNLNTLVVTGPTSTGNRGKRDFEGIITGSGGGSAKVLTKLIAQGSSTIRYLVQGGLSPALAGTISDTLGNSATFVSITPGTLACSAGGSPTATCTNQLESPQRMRTSVDGTNFPQGRGLILENIDGFTNPHSSNHVFRKSPNLENAKRTSPFGLSGLLGGSLSLGMFTPAAVRQHFSRTINRVIGVDFRLPTLDEEVAMSAFQQTRNVPADENFNLDRFATTTAQIAGRTAFFGTAKCSKCHSGPVLADTDGTIPGKTGNANFNTGIDFMPLNTAGDLLPMEGGGTREFNTPALFNVRNHAPFFHNGSAATVRQAVEFYSSGPFQGSPAATEVGGLAFTNSAEIDNIVAFLEGLSVRPYTVTAGPIAFGSKGVTAGATATQPVTITNTSGAPLTLTAPFVRLTGTDSAQFTISSHDVTATLAAGASATANVAFDPTTGGPKTAILELLAQIPSGVSLTGTGVGAAPTITNVSPSSGPTTGGRPVTITGTDLAGATVTIGGTAATVTSTNATTAVFTTPPHAAGLVDVVATTAGGTATSTNAYTYVAPAIIVTPTSGLLTPETGGSATYTMVLNMQPQANVSVAISSSDTTEAVVSPGVVVFTSANFNVPRTITVTGVNDFIADGDVGYTIVNAAASSADSTFNGVNPSDVTGTTAGNGPVAGIIVTPVTGLFTTQTGVTATFTAVLTSAPAANVTFNLTSSDTTEGVVSPSSLTFTPANWFTPRTVTVTGVNDLLTGMPVAYTIVTSAATSADANYNGKNAADVSVTNYKSTRTQIITDLRTAINAKRALAGLGAATFTDPTLTGLKVKAVHITEMRTALDAARAILGQSTGGYTDPTLTSGSTKVKAIHIQELKNRL
jgi:cytochrome c peroxidase